MTAELTCEKVLQTLRSSNLHFVLQETPFSAFITLRKKFISGRSHNSVIPDSKEIEMLELKITELEKEKNSYMRELNNLSLEIQKRDEEVSEVKTKKVLIEKENITLKKNLEEKASELKHFQTGVKNLNSENQKLQYDLKSANKNLKLKEKEIFRLENICENREETSKRLKENISELKSEKRQLLKASKASERKNSKPQKNETTQTFVNTETTKLGEMALEPSAFNFELSSPEIVSGTLPNPDLSIKDLNSNSIILYTSTSALLSPSNPTIAVSKASDLFSSDTTSSNISGNLCGDNNHEAEQSNIEEKFNEDETEAKMDDIIYEEQLRKILQQAVKEFMEKSSSSPQSHT